MLNRTNRYSRLTMLPGIGAEGMAQLQGAKVLVIGCGALGSMCAMQLAASGVGTIGIADFDTIDISNLQRQLFFDENCLGEKKVEILANKIMAINSTVAIDKLDTLITAQKANEIFPRYDFVIDGSDNPATKIVTALKCESLGIPYCIGGVKEYVGQVMSWNSGNPGYTDIFGEEAASCQSMLPCSASGVLGPVAAIVASLQATETIKHITAVGEMLYGRILTFDVEKMDFKIFKF